MVKKSEMLSKRSRGRGRIRSGRLSTKNNRQRSINIRRKRRTRKNRHNKRGGALVSGKHHDEEIPVDKSPRPPSAKNSREGFSRRQEMKMIINMQRKQIKELEKELAKLERRLRIELMRGDPSVISSEERRADDCEEKLRALHDQFMWHKWDTNMAEFVRKKASQIIPQRAEASKRRGSHRRDLSHTGDLLELD